MGDRELSGQILVGKYQVIRLLGEGGMGRVWQAVHTRTGRKVAVKVLDGRFLSHQGVVQRFGREARAASAIQHPGIVEVLDIDHTKDGAPFLVMELLSGDTLAQRLEQKRRLTEQETLAVFEPLLDALGAAHEHGIVHRDLKPDNIVLVPRKHGGEAVKIVDFGISHKADERIAQLTVEGAVLGTPHYLAPEQALGELTIDGRADLYTAAVVMYECLVGQVPFDAPNYNRLLQVILHDDPAPLSDQGIKVSPPVEAAILRALSKRPQDRPQTAAAMLEALRKPTAPTQSDSQPAAVLPRVGELILDSHGTRRSRTSIPARPATSPVPPPMDGGSMFGTGLDDQGSGPLELDESVIARERESNAPAGRRVRSDAPTLPGRISGVPAAVVSSRPPRSGGRTPTSTHPFTHARGRDSSGPYASAAPARSSSWRAAVWAALTVVAGFVLVVGAVRWVHGAGGDGEVTLPSSTVVRAEPPRPRGLDLVTIEIEGLPAEATVLLDGLPAGSLPMRVRRHSRHVVEVSAPGFQTQRFDLTADAPTRLSARLRPDVKPRLGSRP